MLAQSRLRWPTLIALEAALLGSLTVVAIASCVRSAIYAVASWF